MDSENSNGNYGVKIGATAIIWGFATGMLGICVPIISISESGITLPLVVILGANITTIIVWYSGSYKSRKSVQDLQKIEERVRNLEAICSDKELDMTTKIKRLEKVN